MRILIPGYDQSSTLLKVSCQNVMPRQMKSLSFSFVSLLTLLFLLSLLLYRYDEECSEAVPNYLRVKTVSNFVTITRWSVPRKNRNTVSRRKNYLLLIFCVVWKWQCTFRSLFCDQSCALETCFIVTWKISGISSQFRLFSSIPHGTEALQTSNLIYSLLLYYVHSCSF